VLGLVATAIPLEAEAQWVALGWAVMGSALWWFGLRVERGALRGMGAALGLLAVGRLIFDTPYGPRPPFWLLLNGFALPSLGVVGCVLGSVMLVWNNRHRLLPGERTLTIIAGVAAGVLLGWIVSWDLYGWFDVQAGLTGDHTWYWAGQVAVSAWWAAYATALLAVGFRAHRPIARWMALGLFALTTLKVFVVDMASVGGLYRVFALFCLSLLLAGAAWAYQRARVRMQTATQTGNLQRANP